MPIITITHEAHAAIRRHASVNYNDTSFNKTSETVDVEVDSGVFVALALMAGTMNPDNVSDVLMRLASGSPN